MLLNLNRKHVEIRHAHLFCGLGGGAKGMNEGEARLGTTHAKFRCLGGIDVDRACIRDFERLSGVSGTVLDLFNREQYVAFHGCEPPKDWHEATTADIHRAFNNEHPHIIFLSAPCKGFSGLLSESKSKSAKYQALNGLTLRGVWLTLEAHKDDPVELYVFENVPRIASRGRHLLDQIIALFRSYGYAVAETTHDCGELGGLAQSRKRFLLVARHTGKVPSFLYEPHKRPLRAVGDVLSRMPMPGDPAAGPMHRVPKLQWKTWVRLALVEAGSDWRSLNRLAVENGFLRDYGIMPESVWRDDVLGVLRWGQTCGTVTGKSSPTNGRFGVQDVRALEHMRNGYLGVTDYNESAGAIAARSYPFNGKYNVADPIPGFSPATHQNIYRVVPYGSHSHTVTGAMHTAGGAASVADPRQQGSIYGKYAVTPYAAPSGTVISGSTTGQGAFAVADVRGGSSYSGYGVCSWGEASGTVAGESWPTNGKFCVADTRCHGWERALTGHSREGAYGVVDWSSPCGPIAARGRYDNSRLSIADVRPAGCQRERGESYYTAGNYGVRRWDETCGGIHAAACHDNGFNSVADIRLPEACEQVQAVIISLDGTWHRPFTTLELAALQGLLDPEEQLELDGLSDSAWRERIGNAVPPPAARAIAGVMGEVLLLTWAGETFSMSSNPIWVQGVVAGLMAAQG